MQFRTVAHWCHLEAASLSYRQFTECCLVPFLNQICISKGPESCFCVTGKVSCLFGLGRKERSIRDGLVQTLGAEVPPCLLLGQVDLQGGA